MKRIFFILCSALFFLSCNQSANQKEPVENSTHDTHETTELTLNNGAKWQADTMTNRHLISIKTMANMFKVAPFPCRGKIPDFRFRHPGWPQFHDPGLHTERCAGRSAA